MRVFEKVASFILNELGVREPDAPISLFVSALATSKIPGDLRLLLCLGIDLKNIRNINQPLATQAIRSCLETATSINVTLNSFKNGLPLHIKFALAVKSQGNEGYRPAISSSATDKYARVCTFRTYMLYTVANNRGSQNPEVNNIDSGQLDLYWEDFMDHHNYRNIMVSRYGRSESWVFVANKEELQPLGKKTEELVDRLGFYIANINDRDQYVQLAYEFSSKEDVYQPDAVVADWGGLSGNTISSGNESYVSSAYQDSWGRTFSVSGKLDPLQEKVHRDFDFKNERFIEFKASDLNKLDKAPQKCSDKEALKEAYIRFFHA